MKRLLVLAYDYPPNKSIGGARPESWAMQLNQFGVRPTVITRAWEEPLEEELDVVRPSNQKNIRKTSFANFDLITVPYTPTKRDQILFEHGTSAKIFQRKLLTLIQKITDFWRLPPVFKAIQNAAQLELNQHSYDKIIATGEPFLLFRVAQKLSNENKLPWIADYRDCWTGERVYKNLAGIDKVISKLWMEKWEKKIVSSASLITTPSPSYKADIQKIFPSKTIHVIYNGYFEEKIPPKALSVQQDSEVFTIAYIGIIYPHQKLELFFEGLNSYFEKERSQRVKLIFYGLSFYPEQVKRVQNCIQNENIELVFTPKIQYGDLIAELGKSHLFLLLSCKDADWLNTKVFDYLVANRTILLTENDHGILDQILTETKAGFSFSSKEEIGNFLEEKINEFDAKGTVSTPPKSSTYSRIVQTKKLSELI